MQKYIWITLFYEQTTFFYTNSTRLRLPTQWLCNGTGSLKRFLGAGFAL